MLKHPGVAACGARKHWCLWGRPRVGCVHELHEFPTVNSYCHFSRKHGSAEKLYGSINVRTKNGSITMLLSCPRYKCGHRLWSFDCRQEFCYFEGHMGKDTWSYGSGVVRNLQIGRMGT